MGGALGKKQGIVGGVGESVAHPLAPPLPGTSNSKANSGLNFTRNRRGIPLLHHNSLSEFNLTDIANNITHRFSVLSGLSFISFVSVPTVDTTKRPWSRVSRKRWHPSTLQNEYAQSKTVWPVAQTEALFLPEFPVGVEEKLKLIFLGEINRGAFGQVFHVRCSTSHKEYAMKVLSKSQVCSLDAVHQVKQEVMIQHVCSHHPFIASLTHFWQTRKLLIIMTEYIGYGELQQLWRSLGRLPESLLIIYVAEIALALDFLHNAGIIYRDLKMENILLDVDGHIKIIDFGLSRWLSYGGRTKTICGTLQFMAPEILKGEEYGHSADWWSLGIITYSLLTGHYPVSGFDDHTTMSGAVETFSYAPPANFSRPMQSLLVGLLQRIPSARIHTLHQLQKEEIFMHMDLDDVRDKKMSPRITLEEFIEGKSRPNFEEFAGLTSTPKKVITSSGLEVEASAPTCRNSMSFLHATSSKSPFMGGRAVMWDRAKRSSSSPLLSSPLMHPARLGHHDALIKSVSASGYNGAAVPLLQSPLLRLARGQGLPVPSKHSQRAVSASALPTAVSPLLVNVKGNRRARWHIKERPVGKEWDRNNRKEKEADSSSSPIHSDAPLPGGIVSGMNGVYQKCASEECVRENNDEVEGVIKRSKTDVDTSFCSPNLTKHCVVPNKTKNNDLVNKIPWDSLPPLSDHILENEENFKGEFFNELVTSTPKRGGLSTPMKGGMNRNCSSRQSYQMAVSKHGQINNCGLLNGALLGNNNNFTPLDEHDFDDTLDHFPWISESLDT